MAINKKPKKKKDWAEQAVVVKKSHPFAKDKEEATMVAERHARNGVKAVVESPKSYRVILRPKICFDVFRSKPHGIHVTVVHGHLKKGARRSSACR
jgi:hypothetical protein